MLVRFQNVRVRQIGALGLGQLLSLLITGTGICSQYLATTFHVRAPTAQSCLNYLLLSSYFFLLLYDNKKTKGYYFSTEEVRSRWWIYMFLSIADVEANYFGKKKPNYLLFH